MSMFSADKVSAEPQISDRLVGNQQCQERAVCVKGKWEERLERYSGQRNEGPQHSSKLSPEDDMPIRTVLFLLKARQSGGTPFYLEQHQPLVLFRPSSAWVRPTPIFLCCTRSQFKY